MFARFAAFYGYIWRNQFKNEGFLAFAKKEWLEGLQKFNDDILNQVIVACRDNCEMPPSLPQVIGMCRQISKRSQYYVPQNNIIPARKEVVEENLKKCKAILTKQRS